MSKRISQELLDKIKAKLDVTNSRAYALIAQKAGQTHLERHLAALVLAAENGININKRAYATDEDRAQIRTALSGRPTAVVPAVPPAQESRWTGRRPAKRRTAGPARKSNSVWVVHGRDSAARDAMFAFLRALNLQPIEWTQAVRRTRRAAPYVGEVLRAGIDQAAAVVVLLTPDDEARLKRKFQKSSDPAYEKELSGQARPNVIFEAGRAFGSHPNSTVLVQLGQVRPFSNTAGVHVVHLSNDPESRRDLANRLEAAGCAIDDSGSDWLREGDFSPR